MATATAILTTGACSSKGSPATTTTTVAREQSNLLTVNDLPSGWKSFAQRSVDTGPDAGPAADLAACLHSDTGLFRHLRAGHTFVLSPVYQSPEFITFTQSIDVGPSAPAAAADFRAVALPGFATCFGPAFGAVLARESTAQGNVGVSITTATAAPLTIAAVGDRSMAIRANVSLRIYTGDPRQQDHFLYADMIILQVGRRTSILQFERDFSGTDPALEQELAMKVANRLPRD